MSTFIITEKQNVNDLRQGDAIDCQNLMEAKRKASRMQCFQGTVLTIEDENGALLAAKRNGKWAS